MKVGASPRRNLHALVEKMEVELRDLRGFVKLYGKDLLRSFLNEHAYSIDLADPKEGERAKRLLKIAVGQHKGRGVLKPKEAEELRKLFGYAQGWWINQETFIEMKDVPALVKDLFSK